MGLVGGPSIDGVPGMFATRGSAMPAAADVTCLDKIGREDALSGAAAAAARGGGVRDLDARPPALVARDPEVAREHADARACSQAQLVLVAGRVVVEDHANVLVVVGVAACVHFVIAVCD